MRVVEVGRKGLKMNFLVIYTNDISDKVCMYFTAQDDYDISGDNDEMKSNLIAWDGNDFIIIDSLESRPMVCDKWGAEYAMAFCDLAR